MILREVALPGRHAVYAFCDADGECQVERFMLEHADAFPNAIRDLNEMVKEWTPRNGPPFKNAHRAKKLRDGVCEFKAQEKGTGQEGGPDRAPRIMFFEDERIVVCTNAFMKPIPGSTPEAEIEECLAEQRVYHANKGRVDPVVLRGWAL